MNHIKLSGKCTREVFYWIHLVHPTVVATVVGQEVKRSQVTRIFLNINKFFFLLLYLNRLHVMIEVNFFLNTLHIS